MNPIYLDNHSTTSVDPAVLETMLPYFTEYYGNAASRSHKYGWDAEEAVEAARAVVAKVIGASSKDIIFTSGATESINLSIKGIAGFYRDKGDHIITAETEHSAVLDCCHVLAEQGLKVTYLPVDEQGLINLNELQEAISDRTILISIMYANHEIGTLQNIKAIGALAKSKGVFFHCDATQAVGKEKIDVDDQGIDLLSLSGHKLYGPKGVGALYVRRTNPRVRLVPIFSGGGHERGHRSGTLNVPGIVGLGKACEILSESGAEEKRYIFGLRNLLQSQLESSLQGLRVNGHPQKRLAGNLNISFSGIDGQQLLMELQKSIAVSSGASCTSAIPRPSHILKSIRVPADMLHGTIRVGIGRFNTNDEILEASERIIEAVKSLRNKGAHSRSCSAAAS